jgi:hypothetical protein
LPDFSRFSAIRPEVAQFQQYVLSKNWRKLHSSKHFRFPSLVVENMRSQWQKISTVFKERFRRKVAPILANLRVKIGEKLRILFRFPSLVVENMRPQWQKSSLGGRSTFTGSWIFRCSERLLCRLNPLPHTSHFSGACNIIF